MFFPNTSIRITTWLCGMPVVERKEILKRLRKDDTMTYIRSNEDWKNIKNLFCTAMRHRAYDIFTTEILSICFRNSVSLNALTRAQIENIALTEYLIKNPSELQRIFRDKFEFKKTIKSIGEQKTVFRKMFNVLSQRTHSFPEGYKTAFSRMFILHPRKMTWEPIVSIKSNHSGFETHDLSKAVHVITSHFDKLCYNLERIVSLNVQYLIKDASEIHPEGSERPPPNVQIDK